MVYKIKVSAHRRRRPVKPWMQDVLDKMGAKPAEVKVVPHERAHVPRRRPKKPVDPEELL